MEIRHVPGPGVLLGAGDSWLLLDGSPSPQLREQLREALTGTDDVAGRVTAALAAAAPQGGPELVLLVTDAGSVRLGPTAVVPAGAQPGLIEGIPPELLAPAATAAASPAPQAPAPAPQAPAPQAPATDAPEHTVRRSHADHESATVHREPPVDHLQQSTHETVLAVRCPLGHLTAAYSPVCRVCQAPVSAQEPQRVPRPRLGTLRLPDGSGVPLDRGVILGRRPAPLPSAGDWPHLVHLPQDSTYLSRMHLAVELDGWLVLARDLGSRGGTTLRVPGRPAMRIRADEPHVLEPGHVLDLADVYPVTFEITPPAAEEAR